MKCIFIETYRQGQEIEEPEVLEGKIYFLKDYEIMGIKDDESGAEIFLERMQ